MVVQRMTDEDIEAALSHAEGWIFTGDFLVKRFQFENFVESIAFVNRVTAEAEAAQHHPDITVSYNVVTLRLVTHDAGGVTAKDFDLAVKSNSAAAMF